MAGRGARAVGFAAAFGAALFVVAPLVPEWTPGWLERPSPLPLLVALALVATGIGLVLQRGPDALTPRVLLVCGGLPLFALYTGNGMLLTSGDNLATRLIPSRLLTRGTIDLSGVAPFDARPLHYAATRVGERVLSAFPMGTAALAVPHAALALAASRGRVDERLIERWEKHAAACLTLLAVVLFYLAARRFGRAEALGATSVFALATPLPTSASQALWTFTGELPCLTLALCLLLGRSAPALAGAAMGMAFLCRPTALLAGVVLGVALAVKDRRAALRYTGALAAAVALVSCAQLALYGHPLGAYGRGNTGPDSLNRSLAEGLLGVLVSPSRGLLVFFPYVLLLPLGLLAARRRRDPELGIWWTASAAIVLLSVLVTASYAKWWGGHSLGPRLMTEAAPFLALGTVPLWAAPVRVRAALVALVTASAATQVLMAYGPLVFGWSDILDQEGRASLFELGDSQLVAAWTPGWTPPRYDEPAQARSLVGPDASDLTGSIDAPVEGAPVKGPLVVRGWARVPGQDLAVYFVLDGRLTRATRLSRRPRPDVQSVLPRMGDCSTAGYEATFEHPRETPGPHRLDLVLRSVDGRVRHIDRRYVRVD